MSKTLQEIVLKGSAVSEGIAIGKLFFLKSFQDRITPNFDADSPDTDSSDAEKEVLRYRHAVHLSRDDLNNLQCFLAKEGSTEAVAIIATHIQMLEDPFLTTLMEKKIRENVKSSEVVFCSVMSDYEKKFAQVHDNCFRQRLLDVKDLSERILRNLRSHTPCSIVNIPQDSVIFTKELAPSGTAEVSQGQVLGFITEIGGVISHSALIARSKGIPYVANVPIEVLLPLDSSTVVIDGGTGHVIVNPSCDTLQKYAKRKEEIDYKLSHVVEKVESKTRTADGTQIEILANVENINDLDLLTPYKAEGIGLFRSEFLFFGKELHSFSEEEQFTLYQQIMKKTQGMPVVFRVFDVGGDKGNLNLQVSEPNPALGCRAIRFLLRNRKIFTHQLRALLRVSIDGDLRILLPFISDISELVQAKELIHKLAVELRFEGYEIAEEIAIGSMLEVPSAVVICDLIYQQCDFVSIGTNDLIQYTLAADRSTQDAFPFYKTNHPSIIRMIQYIMKKSRKTQTPVSLCGEMASDPLMIPLLIGLGIRILSCAFRYIPLIRKMVSCIQVEEAEALVEEVLQLETSEQIDTLLRERYQKLVFEISC